MWESFNVGAENDQNNNNNNKTKPHLFDFNMLCYLGTRQWDFERSAIDFTCIHSRYAGFNTHRHERVHNKIRFTAPSSLTSGVSSTETPAVFLLDFSWDFLKRFCGNVLESHKWSENLKLNFLFPSSSEWFRDHLVYFPIFFLIFVKEKPIVHFKETMREIWPLPLRYWKSSPSPQVDVNTVFSTLFP